MMRMLVVCYFCPSFDRSGGVQQVVGPMLDQLAANEWCTLRVAHPGSCPDPLHTPVAWPAVAGHTDQVDPATLCDWSDEMITLMGDADVVLSIDRALPPGGLTPRVLMCNTLGYVTEAHAVMALGWSRIVAPSKHLAAQVRRLGGSTVVTIPYGLPDALLDKLAQMPDPDWNRGTWAVWLPHRPDPRKGHTAAITGLASAAGRDIRLSISWLYERRYESFREELECLAESLEVADRVEFLEWAHGDERLERLASTHAIVQLGEFEETFGLSVIEAALAGRVAITRRQAAVREVLGPTPLHRETRSPVDWLSTLSSAAKQLAHEAAPRPQPNAMCSVSQMAQRYAAVVADAVGTGAPSA